MVRPQVEQLEDRTLASVTTTLTNGVLSIVADNQTNYLVVSTPTVGVTEVFNAVANKTTDFTGVNSLRFQGGKGNDTFYNNTALPSYQQANNNPNKTAVLVGGKTNDILDGSQAKGDVYETLTANGTEVGSAGFSNLFALGGTHTITTGAGKNQVYSIVGADTVNATAGTGVLIVSAKATVQAGAFYQIVTFFQPTFAQQTGPVFFQRDRNGNGILYLLPQNPVSVSYVINQTGFGSGPNVNLTVSYTDASGAKQTATFPRSSVSWLAFFSVAGTTQITNNSTCNDVFYAKGNSVLIGGFGQTDVLKEHSGTGMLMSRASYGDLFAGPNGQTTLVGGGHTNVFRNATDKISTTDFNVHKNDVVIGVPTYVNGDFNPNWGKPAVNADYAELFADLQKPIF